MNPTTTSWSDTQKLLAFIVVIAFILVIFVWIFFPPKSDQATITVLNMMIGALVGLAGTVVTFYFGSSRGERTKDGTIGTIATGSNNGNGSSGVTTTTATTTEPIAPANTAPATPPTPPVG